jgi:hypothetical protein
MATSITGLTALTNIDPKRDFLPMVDVSDTTQSANGSTRKTTLANSISPFGYKRVAASIAAGAATVTTIGTLVTTTGTGVTHIPSSTNGLMVNYVSLAFAGTDAGIYQTEATFYRGASAGINGFNLRSRVLLPDGSYNETGASTGSRIGVGLSADTLANTLISDDPAVERVMFRRYSVNAGAIDTNWQVVVRGSGAAAITNTGMAFAVNKVYDFTLDCVPGGTTIDWSVRNVTDSTFQSGTIPVTNLPQATTALRGLLGVYTVDAVARNVRMAGLVVESIL